MAPESTPQEHPQSLHPSSADSYTIRLIGHFRGFFLLDAFHCLNPFVSCVLGTGEVLGMCYNGPYVNMLFMLLGTAIDGCIFPHPKSSWPHTGGEPGSVLSCPR